MRGTSDVRALRRALRRAVGAHAVGAHAVGAHAVGAHAVGAYALGAYALGAHALGAHAVAVTAALVSAARPAFAVEPPFVAVVDDSGALDGPGDGHRPAWERVRVNARVVNRLDVDVTELVLDVQLLRAGPHATAIPGWSFRERVAPAVLAAGDDHIVRIDRPLAPRRASPRADEVTYRLRVARYRLVRPAVDTALRLLASRTRSDQRAALTSFARAGLRAGDIPGIEDELGVTLQTLPNRPDAPDALRLLFVVRAMGSLEASRHISTLLSVVDRVDRTAWGRALVELARTMTAASGPDEPRLEVLPAWARRPPELLAVRAEDALFDAVRDAMLNMGDRAVAPLITIAHEPRATGRSRRARRLLSALGRSTPRAQLRVKDPRSRIAVVRALGRPNNPAAVRPLARTVIRSRGPLRAAAQEALARLEAGAIGPMVALLGSRGAESLVAPLVQLGIQAPTVLARVATQYGVHPTPGQDTRAFVQALRTARTRDHRAQLRSELEAALERGRRGSYRRALETLDDVYARDPELYAQFGPAIAEVYAGRAARFLARGDFDAAVATARVGRAIAPLPALDETLYAARYALARGYLELGALNLAGDQWAALPPPPSDDHRRRAVELERSLLIAQARAAQAARDYAAAQALVDRARALSPSNPEVEALHRALVLAQNPSLVLLFGGLGLVGILFAVIVVARWFVDRRLRRALARS